MGLALRGLEPKTTGPYLAGWRLRVVPSLGISVCRWSPTARWTAASTGGSRRDAAGPRLHVLRKIAGHGSLSTTQRYLHPDLRSITEAGRSLSAHLSPPVGPAQSPGATRRML
nr:hypothetical protein [Streptomyces alkaliphilus]